MTSRPTSQINVAREAKIKIITEKENVVCTSGQNLVKIPKVGGSCDTIAITPIADLIFTLEEFLNATILVY